MAKTEPNAPARWRERFLTEPEGFAQVRRRLVRVVEGPAAPEGAEIVTSDPHDWIEDSE